MKAKGHSAHWGKVFLYIQKKCQSLAGILIHLPISGRPLQKFVESMNGTGISKALVLGRRRIDNSC
jgi:hypothetical protein